MSEQVGVDISAGGDMTCIQWIDCHHVYRSVDPCPYCRIRELEGRLSNEECDSAFWEAKTAEAALRVISLCSQNSMSSKEECGRIARVALKELEHK